MPATCSTKKQFRARLPRIVQQLLPGGAARIRSDSAYKISQAINFNLTSDRFKFREVVKAYDLAFAEVNGGLDKITPEQRDMVNRAIDGDQQALYNLPEVVQPVVSEMRGMIDSLTASLREQGVIDAGLSAVMQENLGAYVTRAFRAYEEDGYGERILALEEAGHEEVVKLMKRLRNKEKASLVRIEANKLAADEYKEKYGVDKITPKIRATSQWKAIYKKHKTQQDKIFDQFGQRVNERVKEFLNVYDEKDKNKVANRMRRDLGILQSRKQMPGWQRQLLGEYETPTNRWLLTVAKQSRMLHTTQALMDLKDVLPDDVLISPEQAKGGSVDGLVRISKEENLGFAPLDGYYIDKEVYDMLRFQFGSKDDHGMIIKAFLKFNAAVKFSFLVLSPATQIRNFASAAMFVTSQGFIPTPSRVKRAVNIASEINFLRRGADPKRKISFAGHEYTLAELGDALLRRGGLNESAAAGDMARLLDTKTEQEVSGFFFEEDGLGSTKKDSWYKRFFSATKTKSESLYQMSDNVFKIVFIEQEMNRLARQYPDKAQDRDWLMDRAVKTARNNLPTYSEVAPGIREYAVLNPLAAPFPSFAYESIRNFYNTGKMALKEVQSSNPAVRKSGIARMSGMLLSAYGLNAAVTGMIRTVAPLVSKSIDFEPLDEEEDKDALRRLVPEYYRDADLVYIGRDKDDPKKHYYTNLSFFNIHSQTVDPIRNLLRTATRRDWDQQTIEYTEQQWLNDMAGSFARTAQMFIDPFLTQPEITSAAIGQALSNSDGRGGVLYNEDIDSGVEKLQKQLGHILTGLNPPIIRTPIRAIEAFQKEDMGQVQRELSGLLGVRVSVLDENYAGIGMASRYNKRRSQASAEMKRAIFDAASSADDIESQVTTTNKEYVKASRELNADIAALAQLSRSSDRATAVRLIAEKKLGKEAGGLALAKLTMLLRHDLIGKDDYIRAMSEGNIELLRKNNAIFMELIDSVLQQMPDGHIVQLND